MTTMPTMSYFNKLEIDILKVLTKEPGVYMNQFTIYRNLIDELDIKDPSEKENLKVRFLLVLRGLSSIFDDISVINKDGILSACFTDNDFLPKTDDNVINNVNVNINDVKDTVIMPSEKSIIEFIVDENLEKYYSKVDCKGNTILHSLVLQNDFERFKKLYLRKNLSLFDENNDGNTPIDLISDIKFSNLFIKKILNDATNNRNDIFKSINYDNNILLSKIEELNNKYNRLIQSIPIFFTLGFGFAFIYSIILH